MPMKTYALAMRDGSRKTRQAHVVRFARDGHPPLEVALHRTPDGTTADHPRSGTARPVSVRTGSPLARVPRPVWKPYRSDPALREVHRRIRVLEGIDPVGPRRTAYRLPWPEWFCSYRVRLICTIACADRLRKVRPDLPRSGHRPCPIPRRGAGPGPGCTDRAPAA